MKGMSALLRTRRFIWIVALVLLASLSVAGYFSGRRYLEAAEWVRHTFEVTSAIDAVLGDTQDLEAGQRGYLLSSDEEFLSPYTDALAALPRDFERLKLLTKDNPQQSERVRLLGEVIEAKRAFAEQTLSEKRRGGDYLALVKSGRGHLLMEQIRDRASELQRVEQRLLAERTEHTAGAQRSAVILSILAVAITLGLALFSLAMVHKDLGELRSLTEEVAVAEKKFRDLAEHASDLIQLVSGDGSVTYVSPSSARLLGYTPDEFMTLGLDALVAGEDLAAVREWVAGMIASHTSTDTMTLRYRTVAGEYRWFEASATLLKESGETPVSLLLSARDVHERHLEQEALEQEAGQLVQLSYTDALTGLLNRRGFMERAGRLLEFSRGAERPLAVVFVDLDGLKPINDQLGHDAGDRAISESARVLRQTCRGGDLVARLGGDEFAVLARDLTPEGYERFRARVAGTLEMVNAESRRPYQLGFSLGAAFYDPKSSETLEELIQRADAVMYEEKRRRKAARA